ncbi:hypothetical protein LOTGIDRAFT_182580 [Lottia gigantea]|uniref:Uncharacterized protein n=1 Tax=Lottia gigantea TaxID=225164 RepID=V4AD94_LOTGI|nr:hypothetical protein LOTGIDRAFT_182580 [Lottia gigantea]ESO91306.1 hypothetical protein LOTGIDRAFT_182580 [Lottia gigantea]
MVVESLKRKSSSIEHFVVSDKSCLIQIRLIREREYGNSRMPPEKVSIEIKNVFYCLRTVTIFSQPLAVAYQATCDRVCG